MSSNDAVLGCRWLGDNIMALPAVLALKEVRPGLRWLLPAAQCELFARGADVETLPLSGVSGDRLRQLRGFDRVLLLPNSFRSAWDVWRAGIQVREGYATDGRRWMLSHSLPKRPVSHQVQDYNDLLASLEVRIHGVLSAPTLDLPSSPPTSPVGFYLGYANNASKAWPLHKWVFLARALLAENCLPTLLVGPGERALADTLLQALGRDLPVSGEDLSLYELGQLLKGFSVIVGQDTGPLHLSAACSTPTVVLFGSTDPDRTAPLGRVTVLADRPSCSPCFLESCPFSHQCMEVIPVAKVADVVFSLLQR